VRAVTANNYTSNFFAAIFEVGNDTISINGKRLQSFATLITVSLRQLIAIVEQALIFSPSPSVSNFLNFRLETLVITGVGMVFVTSPVEALIYGTGSTIS
jgi:hypothetical protein